MTFDVADATSEALETGDLEHAIERDLVKMKGFSVSQCYPARVSSIGFSRRKVR